MLMMNDNDALTQRLKISDMHLIYLFDYNSKLVNGGQPTMGRAKRSNSGECTKANRAREAGESKETMDNRVYDKQDG